MRVAFVHDYLIQDGGAERVLLAMRELYPDAPIFTLFFDPSTSHPAFRKADVRPSFLNRLPFAKRHYQWYLPLMSQAVEQFDLSSYDLVISNTSNFAKGAIASPSGIHICYCHTPTRFLWQERVGYVNELPQPSIIKKALPPFLHWLRQWDQLAANRPDLLITNSRTSQERIRRYYRRQATVIAPPVDVERMALSSHAGSYWLAGGRLVAYKRFDLIVHAFAKLNLPLKIFGIGPEEKKLRRTAGPRTEFLGRVSEEHKADLYGNAIAYLHPQAEDFGITAVEAMSAGKPVIAYGKGGALETVLDGTCGIYLESQCWEDIGNAVIRFDPSRFSPSVIRAHAEPYAKKRFLDEMRGFIASAIQGRGV